MLKVGDVFRQNDTNGVEIKYSLLFKTPYTDSDGFTQLVFEVFYSKTKQNHFYTTLESMFEDSILQGDFTKIQEGIVKSETFYIGDKVYTKQQLEEILGWWEK